MLTAADPTRRFVPDLLQKAVPQPSLPAARMWLTATRVLAALEGVGYFAAFFFAAHRAFNAATIFARPSGLSLPFFFGAAAVGAFAAGGVAPFTLAHRALAAAAIFARASGEMFRAPFFLAGAATGAAATVFAGPFTLAHRAFCDAAILARAAADTLRLPLRATGVAAVTAGRLAATEALPPTILASCDCSCSICSAMLMACLSWAIVGMGMDTEVQREVGIGQ